MVFGLIKMENLALTILSIFNGNLRKLKTFLIFTESTQLNPMEPIQVFKKTGQAVEWEYMVLVGHDSHDVGFLVKVDQEHWIQLTNWRVAPELLIKKSFRFLLKKQSKSSIPMSFDLRDIQRRFPDFHV